MNKPIVACVVTLAMTAFACVGQAAEKNGKGAELFKKHCAVCHPNGGNIINPKKTLSKVDREAHGIKTADDIAKNMRNPGPGMVKFDEKTIPDKDAKLIADYILKTFK